MTMLSRHLENRVHEDQGATGAYLMWLPAGPTRRSWLVVEPAGLMRGSCLVTKPAGPTREGAVWLRNRLVPQEREPANLRGS